MDWCPDFVDIFNELESSPLGFYPFKVSDLVTIKHGILAVYIRKVGVYVYIPVIVYCGKGKDLLVDQML